MTTVNEVYSYFDGLFPKSLACDWDNDGLMVCGKGNAAVKNLLISLDATEQTLEYAEKNGFDTVITHHPLIFRPLTSLNESQCAVLPLSYYSSGISVMSFHTRFDAAEDGMNDTLAEILGLPVSSSFGPEGEECGRICTLPEPLTFSSLCNRTKTALCSPNICAAKADEFSQRIALLGGDGKDFIGAAIKAGADTFITGGASYNSMLDASAAGLSVIEAGHWHTEFYPFTKRISELISKKFPDLHFQISPVGCEILYI